MSLTVQQSISKGMRSTGTDNAIYHHQQMLQVCSPHRQKLDTGLVSCVQRGKYTNVLTGVNIGAEGSHGGLLPIVSTG